jgi:hypothetical protein
MRGILGVHWHAVELKCVVNEDYCLTKWFLSIGAKLYLNTVWREYQLSIIFFFFTIGFQLVIVKLLLIKIFDFLKYP